eukprot:998778-Lingulodinium_polyedra.AAC.1
MSGPINSASSIPSPHPTSPAVGRVSFMFAEEEKMPDVLEVPESTTAASSHCPSTPPRTTATTAVQQDSS